MAGGNLHRGVAVHLRRLDLHDTVRLHLDNGNRHRGARLGEYPRHAALSADDANCHGSVSLLQSSASVAPPLLTAVTRAPGFAHSQGRLPVPEYGQTATFFSSAPCRGPVGAGPFEPARAKTPAAGAGVVQFKLICTSTPAARSSFMSASTVFSVGSRMSRRRLVGPDLVLVAGILVDVRRNEHGEALLACRQRYRPFYLGARPPRRFDDFLRRDIDQLVIERFQPNTDALVLNQAGLQILFEKIAQSSDAAGLDALLLKNPRKTGGRTIQMPNKRRNRVFCPIETPAELPAGRRAAAMPNHACAALCLLCAIGNVR